MRALTLTQPWCGLVASGIKMIENRPRAMIKHEDFGTLFALHASREIDAETYHRIFEVAPELRPELATTRELSRWHQLARITSAVIAVATVDRVIFQWQDGSPAQFAGDPPMPADQRRWFFGPVGYVLRDVRALPVPVPCKGRLGFWTLPPDVEARVRFLATPLLHLEASPSEIEGSGGGFRTRHEDADDAPSVENDSTAANPRDPVRTPAVANPVTGTCEREDH